jgi:hypothetical protein
VKFLIFLMMVGMTAGAQQTSAPAADAQVFRIRVVDGRNGAPMQGAHVQIWYDEPAGPGVEVSTGPTGYALMPAPVGDPLRILVAVANFADCRRTHRYDPPPAYNMQEIAKGGVAAENTCGQVAQRTKPGELLLFARPAKWYEQLNKTPQ